MADAEMGAAVRDEYVTKPFRPRELRARIEALLRRVSLSAPPPAEPTDDGLDVDLVARSVRNDGALVPLTRTEYELFAALHEAGGRTVAKGELARRLWPDAYTHGACVSDADLRTVEVHLANLRRKLGESPGQPRHVHTVRGQGYRFVS